MEPKKNPKADLSKRSIFFFQIGLIIMLFVTWQAIEWKTYDKSLVDIGQLNLEDEDEEEIPITEFIPPPPPPPPPPPAPEIIEVVDDEEEIEETIIESTETDQFEEIVEIETIEEAVEEIDDVPFAVIENVPIYPGCENMKNNQQRKDCMSEKIQAFVTRKFNTELANDLGLSGRQRISVQFKIDNKGNVVEVLARAPHPRLESEAKNVISQLPKMTPGKQRGKAVNVMYSLPILFQVEN
ncbi:energy transducer TonB [uncultured Planktosalinus sp.]|uniref:energy transducer TonB n=1 Tax=uncultured Planktosalinus sp. TaxID=1810935 RepID=UPI0030DC59A1